MITNLVDSIDLTQNDSEDFSEPPFHQEILEPTRQKFQIPSKENTEDCKLIQDVINAKDRTIIFIDGGNLYAASRDIGLNIDFKELRKLFLFNSNMLRICYYNNIVVTKDKDLHNPIKPLVKYLSFNGYDTNIEEISERENSERNSKFFIKMRMLVDMMTAAFSNRIDHVILIAGSSHYVYPITAIKKLGIKVTVISTQYAVQTENDQAYIFQGYPSVSNDLRSCADNFLDLKDLYPYVMKG